MKRKGNGTRKKKRYFRLWTQAKAKAARPYLVSVMRSLREHLLEAMCQRQTLQRVQNKPGRPDRATLIALQEVEQLADRAEEEFQEAAEELWALDIYPVDGIQGLAQVPFAHEDQLAWYLFDLFDPVPFRFWRFQSDPEDTRRPITTLQAGQPGVKWSV